MQCQPDDGNVCAAFVSFFHRVYFCSFSLYLPDSRRFIRPTRAKIPPRAPFLNGNRFLVCNFLLLYTRTIPSPFQPQSYPPSNSVAEMFLRAIGSWLGLLDPGRQWPIIFPPLLKSVGSPTAPQPPSCTGLGWRCAPPQ